MQMRGANLYEQAAAAPGPGLIGKAVRGSPAGKQNQ